MAFTSRFETLDATYANSCAVQTCKKLNEIFSQRCCGCKISWENQDCEMLTQTEKVDLYFDEAFHHMNMVEVEARLKDCVCALIPKKKDRDRFWQRLPMDPRKNEVFKRRVKDIVTNIMNF